MVNMAESKTIPPQKLHKIVWILVGVFTLFAGTFPLAMWRVSQMDNFRGYHVKSVPNPHSQKQVIPEVKAVVNIAENSVITDSNQLEELQQTLYQSLDTAWQTWPTFTTHLMYQVSVNLQGEIANYIPLNQSAKDYLQEIPLSQLKTALKSTSPLGEFIVIFTPNGSLELSPLSTKNP